jgi:hypothetical protein
MIIDIQELTYTKLMNQYTISDVYFHQKCYEIEKNKGTVSLNTLLQTMLPKFSIALEIPHHQMNQSQ